MMSTKRGDVSNPYFADNLVFSRFNCTLLPSSSAIMSSEMISPIHKTNLSSRLNFDSLAKTQKPCLSTHCPAQIND